MSTSKNMTRVAFLGACAFALCLGASSAQADVAKCQSALQKFAVKHNAATGKALVGCANTVAKVQGKGDPITQKEADKCNKGVDKLAATRTKSVEKCEKLVEKHCPAETLRLMGHMVSGSGIGSALPSAPGTQATTFACKYIMERAKNTAIANMFASNPSMQVQISEAAGVGPGAIADFYATEPSCSTHACSLAASPASGASLKPGFAPPGIPVSTTGTLLLDICSTPPDFLGDGILIGGSSAAGIAPIGVLGNSVCINTVNAEGHCRCTNTVPPAYNYSLCRDSDTSGGTDPGLCTGPVTLAVDPDPLSNNGALTADFTGAVPAGGCLGSLAVSFTVFPTVVSPSVDCGAPPVAPLPGTGIPFTTGTASADILNTNDSGGDPDLNGTRVGAAGASCGDMRTSNLSGLALAGAVPTMDGSFGDSIIDLRLECD